MKIYTKTGDNGETSLLGGERVTKDCVNLRVVGELDELNAVLGVVVSMAANDTKISLCLGKIKQIQRDLFKIGAEIAATQIVIPAKAGIQDAVTTDSHFRGNDSISKEVFELENSIDEMTQELPELRNFILPGGSTVSAQLHLARTICRRSERELVAMGKVLSVRSEIYKYLNRLSDWLFVSARWVNFKLDIRDEII